MKKIFTFLSVGVTALALSAVAVGQMKKARVAYGAPPKVEANGGMLSAKAQKSATEVSVTGKITSEKLHLTDSQKSRLEKMLKVKKTAVKSGRPAYAPMMKLQRVAPFESEVNAKITLDVQGDYGDDTGFQLLLDSGHDSYGEDFAPDYFYASDYSAFEYAIPEDADKNSTGATGGCLLAGDKQSIEIPAGVYDYAVVNPDPDSRVFIVSGSSVGTGDDYSFEAGVEYVFSIIPDGYYIMCELTALMPVDMAVDGITSLATSSSLTDSETVTATVRNNGLQPTSSFDMKLTVDGSEVATETVSQALEAGEEMQYTFNAKADLSAEGSHAIAVEVIAGGDGNADNNVATIEIQHYVAAGMPYKVDFLEASQPMECWWEGESWSYDEENRAMYFDGYDYQPLVFRGMNLEAGKAYKFEFVYAAGYEFYGYALTENFKVVCGREGTSVDGWAEVLSYPEEYTESYFVTDDGTIKCEESGVYSVAIVPVKSNGMLLIRQISVSERQSYDASLASVSAPSRIPAGQASKFTVTAKVANEGSNAIEAASVVVKNGEAEVGHASVHGIAAGQTVEVPVEVALADAAAGSVANLEVSVAIDGHEGEDTSDDNSVSKPVSVTEEELGYDYVTEGMYIDDYCIGTEGGAIGCGVPFHLAAEDVLTGISLGWGAADGQSIQIAVYEYDPATLMLGNEIFSEVVPQGTETGQIVYEISPRKLEAGDYMASVVFSGFCLVTNKDVPGMLYLTSGNPVGMQNNLGTPAIRTVFGEGEVVLKDAVVAGFSKPADSGLFSTNEPVVVSVKNDGCDEITGTLALSINGENAGSQSITLGGYASAEFTFEADLSKPGEYVLEAVATVEGDENPDNNSASKTVISVEPADPYVMDFEQCEDFAISGFNPAWRTVDADGNYIYGFQDVSFPAPSSGKAAYIVFNPALTTPSLEDQAAIAPHGGERFAASFASSGDPSGLAQNNDWLISPKLTLPATDAKMSFFVKSYIGEYGLEKYNVLVSETDDNLESFKMIGSTREAPEEAWTEVSVDLSEYAGKDVYLAIQCVSEDAFVFMLDDITVSKGDASVAENAVAMLSLYPNPATDMIVISSGGSEIESVDIYNAAGAMIYSSQASDGNSFRYNVSSLDAGIYFAKVATSDGTKVMRFIVR